MAKKDYKKLSKDIVENIGGVENVASLTHCMTRLRFTLVNEDQAQTDEIKSLEGVLSVVKANGQYQVIIGNDVVNVFDAIMSNYDIKADDIVDDEKMRTVAEKPKGIKGFLATFIDYVTGTMTQILPILIGAGLLSVILTFATKVFGLPTDNPTYQIFNYVYNTGFYYLPIFVGFAASRKLKSNPFITAMIGAVLLHPTYVGLLGEGTSLSILGMPVTSIPYASTVIPMLLIAFVSSYVEKFLIRVLPNAIKSTFAPLLQLIIMVPLALIVIGPLGYFVGTGIVKAILWVYGVSPFLIVPLTAVAWPILVMFGAHTLLVPTMTELIGTVGFDAAIRPGAWVSSFVIIGICLAVGFKSKKLRGAAIPATISALFGVTEPAMYGIIVPMKKTMVTLIAGSFLGGILAGLLGMRANVMAANSILSIVMFSDTFIQAIIVTLASVAIGFVLTLIIGFDEA